MGTGVPGLWKTNLFLKSSGSLFSWDCDCYIKSPYWNYKGVCNGRFKVNLKWSCKIFNRSEDRMCFNLFSVQNASQNGIKASNQVSRCPRHVKVRNLENGSSYLDTLHLTAKEVRSGNLTVTFHNLDKKQSAALVCDIFLFFRLSTAGPKPAKGHSWPQRAWWKVLEMSQFHQQSSYLRQ